MWRTACHKVQYLFFDEHNDRSPLHKGRPMMYVCVYFTVTRILCERHSLGLVKLRVRACVPVFHFCIIFF